MNILIYTNSTSASPSDHDRNNLAAIPRCWPLTCLRQSEAESRAQVFDWKRRQNSFSVVPQVYPWLVQRSSSSARNTWATGGAFDGAALPANLGKFKALPAHFVCKEQITDPKAESLWVFFSSSLPLISFFSPPAVPSDLGLLFLLLQTSVLCCCKNRYPTSGPAHFDSSQWDTKAGINT